MVVLNFYIFGRVQASIASHKTEPFGQMIKTEASYVTRIWFSLLSLVLLASQDL